MTFEKALSSMKEGFIIYRERYCCEYFYYMLKEGKLYSKVGGCDTEWQEGCYLDDDDILSNDWEIKNW